MTREDKRYIVALLITILLTIWGVILYQRAAGQPQPRLDVTDQDWALLEFDNGSQWYMSAKHLVAIHAVPKDDQETLGYKTVLYLSGHRVTTPYTAVEIEGRLIYAPRKEILSKGTNGS